MYGRIDKNKLTHAAQIKNSPFPTLTVTPNGLSVITVPVGKICGVGLALADQLLSSCSTYMRIIDILRLFNDHRPDDCPDKE